MDPHDRLREILPFAAALYLAGSVAQLQATPSTPRFVRDGITVEALASGLKWHMLAMAKNEQAEAQLAYPGD